VTGLLTIA